MTLPTPPSPAAPLALTAALALVLTAGPALADDPLPATGTTQAPAAEPTTTPTTPEASTPPAPANPTTPATSPSPTPLSMPGGDRTAPKVTIRHVPRALDRARRHGLRVTYSVSEPVRLRADVLILGEVTDHELLMSAEPAAGPGDSLAKATLSRTRAGTQVVRLQFNPAARRTLRKFFKITVRVRLIATDPAGNETKAYRRVTLSDA